MSGTQRDDLTVIKGISKARQGTLREESGICTLQELAAISDEKASSVAKRLTGVSADMVRGWRVQAQEEASALLSLESANEDSKGTGSSNTPTSEWKSFASFIVVVQARQMQDGTREQRLKVHHRETDKHMVWPGDDTDWLGLRNPQPWEWIVDRLGETGEAVLEAEEEAPVKPTSASLPPVHVSQAEIRVTHINAYQPVHAQTPVGVGKAGAFFRGTIRGREPFALEACFELAATNGAKVAQERGTYQAEFYASNRSTGERVCLNNTEPQHLIENQSSYTAFLPSATLPPGNYKLQVLITLVDRAQGLGFLEVPMLQVV